jgi:hypothetical protein
VLYQVGTSHVYLRLIPSPKTLGIEPRFTRF